MRVSPAGSVVSVWILTTASFLSTADAQGVRGDARLTVGVFEYRTTLKKSVNADSVGGQGVLRVLPDGTVVSCPDGVDCSWYEPGPKSVAAPMTQELRLTAWSNVQGLSARAHLRSRLGSDGFWPGSLRELEALDVHVSWERRRLRLKAGRMQRFSGLGLHYFDGGAVLWKQSRALSMEMYGGRSRGRTVNQPRTGELLGAVEELPPQVGSVLLGGELWVQLGKRFDAALIYQRELQTDRRGLYSERLGINALWRGSAFTLEGEMQYDWALSELNRLRLSALVPVSLRTILRANAKQVRPFTELWTIWGAFSPVAYRELEASGSWKPSALWSLAAGTAYRKYQDTQKSTTFLNVSDDGWRGNLSAGYAEGLWRARGRYTFYSGYGVGQGSLDLSAGRTVGSGYLGLFAKGSREVLSYRVGSSLLGGIGVEGRTSLGSVDVNLNAGVYRHEYEDRPSYTGFSQFRTFLAAVYSFGSEPQARVRTRGRALQ